MLFVDLKTLEAKKYGVSNPSELKKRETLIYDSDTLISTMDYAGPINTIIHNASGISSNFTNQLQQIKHGYCSLGGQWSNANLYGANARSLSGAVRICYIRGIDDSEIQVMEYYGSRGSKFSGYYPLLLKKVRKSEKFKVDNKESFFVNLSNIGIFVDIMNDIMDDIINDRLEMLKVEGVYDKIKIEGKYYYYNIVIWDYKTKHNSIKKEYEKSVDLKQSIETIVEHLINRDMIKIDDFEIDIKAIRQSKSKDYSLIELKDKLEELTSDIEGLSEEADALIECLDGSICDIYEGLTQEMIDSIEGHCSCIKENIDVIDAYTAERIKMLLSKIEEIVNSPEIIELAQFDSEQYAMRTFREKEEKFGYNEDMTDDRINSASCDAVEKGEELYYSAEKLLEELKYRLKEICDQ